MAYFKDTEELYECLGTLFQRVSRDKDLGPKIANSGLIVRFVYNEPDGQITTDTKNRPENDPEAHFKVVLGACDLEPDVTMTMKADIGHQFWFGKVNLLMAVNRRQIVPKGPMAKIFKLLPVIVPAYKIYPQVIKDLGKDHIMLT